jgi:hypothetical protein
VQEEGWVVCRAFQKPVPNQRHFAFPAYAAAPGGYYDDARLRLHGHGGDLHYLHPAAAGAGGFAFPGHDQFSDQDFESKKNLLSNIPQLIESPPTTTAVVVGCGDAGYDVVQQQQQGQGASANAIDWNFLDSLLSTSLLHDPYSAASAASHLHLQ